MGCNHQQRDFTINLNQTAHFKKYISWLVLSPQKRKTSSDMCWSQVRLESCFTVKHDNPICLRFCTPIWQIPSPPKKTSMQKPYGSCRPKHPSPPVSFDHWWRYCSILFVKSRNWMKWLKILGSTVNPGLINHGLSIRGGTPPIVIVWYLNGTPLVKQPFGVY